MSEHEMEVLDPTQAYAAEILSRAPAARITFSLGKPETYDIFVHGAGDPTLYTVWKVTKYGVECLDSGLGITKWGITK